MKILNGKKIAGSILKELKKKIKEEKLSPMLAVILIGTDEASHIYVNLKGKSAKRVGIGFERIDMKDDVTEEEVLEKIQELNMDSKISGTIVQLPLPAHLDKNRIIQSISPKKDVDGFSVQGGNYQKSKLEPVFPHALLELLKSSREDLKNKNAIILCNSQEFGGMMQGILESEGMIAQYIFRFQIPEKLDDIKTADVVISACGQKNLIGADMVKKGVIIIDGGIVRVDGKVRGDADGESLKGFPGYLSPVPGGVGPVTIACLLRNVYLAAKK
ncbi:MAG TPA: bifunctional methylenetetrahydrofolate dehydrogenase/methenyltetrahydrofolate cyclohydrolase [Candidatus Moranbacteria bacterium]|nr:bifunctional methylenetetrahydrofolate dehydrogenase/methenyltetrahydrofolate cyclohydrolase [Candidatus Moranbacteria bacterium]